ncbi:MAG TPA: hypothetical protein VF804_09155 [Holophagaceae bacterium]
MISRILRGLAACTLLLLPFACKDAVTSGSTSGVALYAFDSTTSTVMAWNDLEALYSATSTPAPDRTLTSSLLSKVSSLGWGGLCLDSQRGLLYLVSDSGTIVRINRLRSQTGAVPSTDITSFTLSTTDRLTNGKFGQASIDPQTDTLYITENGDNGTRIWVVANASTQLQDNTITLQALQASGDSGGTGVAAGSGNVYAYFQDGNPVGPDVLTGPRLRSGTQGGFSASSVILGSLTALGKYGSLALDTGNGYLYVARHNTDSGSTAAPVEVFRTGQFGMAYNQAPAFTLGSATAQPDLRVIAHPGTKDWLVGLRGQGTTGYPTLILWKSPLGGTDAKVQTASPSTTVFRGLAMDGNAS